MRSRSALGVLFVALCLMLHTSLARQWDNEAMKVTAQEGIEETGGKSVLMAVALSLVLPGMGELYAGKFESGKYHLYAEGGIWLGYAGMKSYSDWIRTDARTFAVEHASAQFGGKNAQFEVDLGDFNSTREYNEEMLKRRNVRALYEHPSYTWEWDSDLNRQRFRDLRIKSDRLSEHATFLIGAAVLNRVISAFSAGRAAARQNSTAQQSWDVRSGIVPHRIAGQSLVVRFSTVF
ncbi:MAG: hypothetical protein FJ215_03495 [Ignavibacteria bacterium]|nr:hypothetical protein [Ignavibacteria bacterium]